jgi:NAD-dependent SIR2 family protein deacetylase
MNDKASSLLKECKYCKKPLHGRLDQVYCNDACRNTYNRNKRAYEKIKPHPNAPEIFQIIKKNYELLKQGFPGQIEEKYATVCDTEVFVSSGINLKFYTSSFQGSDKQQWYCVFDRCYSINLETTKILDVREQAEL